VAACLALGDIRRAAEPLGSGFTIARAPSCDRMNRRTLLTRLGLVGLAVGGGWWLRDHVLWRKPTVAFDAAQPWQPYAARSASPTVRVRIGGRQVTALIDTGALFSAIDRTLYAALGSPAGFDVPLVAYGVGGAPQVGRGVTLDMDLPGLQVRSLRTAILALGPLADDAGPGIRLILGRDLLSMLLLDLDTPARRLRLLDPAASIRPSGLTPLAVQNGPRGLVARVSVEGAPVPAIVDTGATGVLSLSRSAAATVGLLDGRPGRSGTTIVLGGRMGVEVVEAETLGIGERQFRKVPVGIYPDIDVPGFPQALIGMGAFRGSRVSIDLDRGALQVGKPEMDVVAVPAATKLTRGPATAERSSHKTMRA